MVEAFDFRLFAANEADGASSFGPFVNVRAICEDGRASVVGDNALRLGGCPLGGAGTMSGATVTDEDPAVVKPTRVVVAEAGCLGEACAAERRSALFLSTRT